MMWFKLLFVPVLGVIILALFLLEEYCAIQRLKGPEKRSRNTNASPQPVATRISFVDPNGTKSCYKIEPTVSMQSVLKFYCEKHGMNPEELILRHKGQRLPLSATPAELALEDLAVIDVEPDYNKLLGELQKETQSERDRLELLLEREKLSRETSQHRLSHIQADFQQLLQAGEELKRAVVSVESEKRRLAASLAKLERDLRTHQEARKEADLARSVAERELNLDTARQEKKHLEKTLSALRGELENKKKALLDLRTQHDQGVKEQQSLEGSLRETFSELGGVEKELNRWKLKANKLSALQDKLATQDALRGEHASWRKKLEQAEKDQTNNTQLLAQCKQKAKDLDTTQKELAKAKARLQVSEQTLHELEVWKDEVGKGYAMESKQKPQRTHILKPNNLKP